MAAELTALALAALLLAVQLAMVAVRANREIGSAYFLSARDDPLPRPLSQGTARLKRAYENHLEALPLFAVAVVVVVLSDRAGAFTALCAWAYLVARVAFVPAYLLGWQPWRSLFFGVGFLASVAMLLAALL